MFVLNRLHLDIKKWLPTIIVFFGLLINKTCSSKSDVLQVDYDDSNEPVEKISFCDENLIKKRESSKR